MSSVAVCYFELDISLLLVLTQGRHPFLSTTSSGYKQSETIAEHSIVNILVWIRNEMYIIVYSQQTWL